MLTINKDLKLYTNHITNSNFDEKISIRKILFDLQFESNKVYGIAFDSIPTKQNLKDFYNFLNENSSVTFNDSIIIFRTANAFVKTINKSLNNERKLRKESDDDSRSYKVFINDKRVYNNAIKVYSCLKDNKLLINISTTKVWNGPIANAYNYWSTDKDIKYKPSCYLNFNNIQF